MPREKTVRVDFRISEREEARLHEVMEFGNWNRSEALRFLLNFGHVVLSMLPELMFETFLDKIEDSFIDEEKEE